MFSKKLVILIEHSGYSTNRYKPMGWKMEKLQKKIFQTARSTNPFFPIELFIPQKELLIQTLLQFKDKAQSYF